MAKKSSGKRQSFLHASGQYAKKIGGQWFCYGKDKEVAVAAWQKQFSDIASDIAPPPRGLSPSPVELGNVYADHLRRQVEKAELSERTAAEYKRSIHRLVRIAGTVCQVAALRPIDIGAIKERFADPVGVAAESRRYGGRSVKRRAISTVAIDIRNLRVFLN